MMGLSQTILLGGINAFGYIIPESTSQIIRQPEAIQTFFGWSFAGIPMIGFGICAVIMLFLPDRQQKRMTLSRNSST